jgi:TolB protein
MKTRLLAAALFLAPAVASAQRTYIEVGSPNFRPLPVAVANFGGESGLQAQAAEMTQILRADLQISGLFDVLDPKSFLADAAEGVTAPSIRFSRWSDVGAEGLVKGLVRQGSPDITGDFHLFEVRAGREVLAKVYHGSAKSARVLAHRFADDIIRYYTREPGVFSTRILAVRRAGAGREIVAFDVDGRNAETLYRDPGILFTSFRSGRPALWSLDLTTRRARQLIALGDMASGGVYSPDGRRIAFTASQNGNSDVWVASADGSHPRRLTTDPGIDSSPSWSPDGRRICFVSNRSGNAHLYIMGADGSGQRRLTFQGNYNQTPRWSPRGDLIAFTARDERKVFDIFTISPDTGQIQRVTQDQGRTNEEPTWAPNGRLLAFTTDRAGRSRLVVSNPTGDRQTLITQGGNDLSPPAWGPLPAP